MARWISGILIAVLVVALLQYAPLYLIDGVVVLVGSLTLFEYFQMALRNTPWAYRALGIFLGTAACVWLVVRGPKDAAALLVGLVIITFFIHLWGAQDMAQRMKKVAFFYLGIMFMSFLTVHLSWVAHLPHGRFWVYLMLACTFMADTGAYIFGKWLGRYHIAPLISPGKTLEGFMGGVLFSLVGGFIVRAVFWPEFPLGALLMIASIIPFVGLVGDLSESVVKRAFGVKDSGKLIPGHGGMWDRIDALLFVAPMVYYFAIHFV